MNIGERVKVEFEGTIQAIELKDNKVLYTIVGDTKYPKPFAAMIQEEQIVSLKDIDAGMEKAYNELG